MPLRSFKMTNGKYSHICYLHSEVLPLAVRVYSGLFSKMYTMWSHSSYTRTYTLLKDQIDSSNSRQSEYKLH